MTAALKETDTVVVVGASAAGLAAADGLREGGFEGSITVNVARIGHDYADANDDWAQVGEIGNRGAVLVRPDNHVGWRATDEVEQPEHVLTAAFETILGRR
jgi:NADPH-dependent 2,4-dienoyl-CoA reductase/sulfur reductase-like enzyme